MDMMEHIWKQAAGWDISALRREKADWELFGPRGWKIRKGQDERRMTEAEQIYRYMKELTAVPSISGTRGEKDAGEKIYSFIREQDYFKRHPELAGKSPVLDDAQGREILYGLVRGKGKKR